MLANLYLLNVPFTNLENEFYFNSETARENYFKSRKIDYVQTELTGYSYIRKNNTIEVPFILDYILDCNYVMYQNQDYADKWFYAFVTDLEYVSEYCTRLYIKEDVYQTWSGIAEFHPSFVERECVCDDSVGKHTVPEGLETGEYIVNQKELNSTLNSNLTDLCYIVGATTQPVENGEASGSDIYNGIMSGVKYYRYDTKDAVEFVLDTYSKNGQIEGVTGVFMAPKFLAPLKTDTVFREVQTSYTENYFIIGVSKNTSLNGYTPHNNKLLCYPYNFLTLSNNNGVAVPLNYEDFSTSNCGFRVIGSLCPGGSVRIIPRNYKNVEENDDEGINLGKYPICNYLTDMYTNWMTQNSLNLGLNLITSAGTAISGGALMATGGGALAGAGMIASGLSGVLNTVSQAYPKSLVPNQVQGNTNCGDVITSSSKNTFYFYKMSIKEEYAKIIDKFFDKFGYKINTVKNLEFHSRRYWNYIKTIDVNITGKIPKYALDELKEMFNNGTTLWHDTNNMYNYNLNNSII